MPPIISRSALSRPASAMATRRRSSSSGVGEPERVEAVAVPDDAPQQRAVQRHAAEPHPRPLRPERLRLEVHVVEREVPALERRGRLLPRALHRHQLLVEDGAALVERHAERLVLVLVPRHGRLHDEAPLGQQVERRELLGEQQRMAQRRDHGGQRDADLEVAAAIALASTIESGHGVAGSWLPGAA